MFPGESLVKHTDKLRLDLFRQCGICPYHQEEFSPYQLPPHHGEVDLCGEVKADLRELDELKLILHEVGFEDVSSLLTLLLPASRG